MNPQWFDILGLLFTLCGAIVLAWGLMIPRKGVVTTGISRLADEKENKNIILPGVQDRLRVSQHARAGLVLFVLGCLLQMIGHLLRL